MSNNSKLNTVLLVLIFIFLSIGVYLFMGNKKVGEIEWFDQIDNNIFENHPELVNPNYVGWVKSEKSGLYVPSNLKEDVGYYLTPAQQENKEKGGTPTYNFSSSNFVISWGGHQSACLNNEFGQFKIGISTQACLNEMTAYIRQLSPEYKLTSEDLKIFGDFVMKNQSNKTGLTTYENKELGFSFESPYGEVKPMENGKFIFINNYNPKEDKGEMFRGDIFKNPSFYFTGISRDYNAGTDGTVGDSRSENCSVGSNKKTLSGVDYKYSVILDKDGLHTGERNSKAYVAYFKMKSSFGRFPCLGFALWPQKSGVTEAEFLKIMNSVKIY